MIPPSPVKTLNLDPVATIIVHKRKRRNNGTEIVHFSMTRTTMKKGTTIHIPPVVNIGYLLKKQETPVSRHEKLRYLKEEIEINLCRRSRLRSYNRIRMIIILIEVPVSLPLLYKLDHKLTHIYSPPD